MVFAALPEISEVGFVVMLGFLRIADARGEIFRKVHAPRAAGLAAHPPRQGRSDISAARDGREIIDASEQPCQGQTLQDAEREGRGPDAAARQRQAEEIWRLDALDRQSTRLNSSH